MLKPSRARLRVRMDYHPHPLRIYRTTRLARLLSVDVTTIWRWRKSGVLPPPVEIGPGVRGWTEEQLKDFLDQRRAEASNG